MTPSILIADDHSMIRKGLKLLLMKQLDCKNVSEAGSCSQVMSELKNAVWTHLVLDVIFSDGSALEIVPTIRKLYPDIKILIFSMQPKEIYADAFRQYDVHYYLSKSLDEVDILKNLRRFLENETYPVNYKITTNTSPFSLLAPRELEILHYLLNGFKTQDIANTLNLGDSTVSTFKKRIFEKTGATNLAQLFELASLNNLGFYSSGNKGENGEDNI
jgi:two-component system invasion response regulator UvrY